MGRQYKKIGIISSATIIMLLLVAIVVVVAEGTDIDSDTPLFEIRSEKAINNEVEIQALYLELDESIIGSEDNNQINGIPWHHTILFGYSCSWGSTCAGVNTCNGGPTCNGAWTCNMAYTCGYEGTCSHNGGQTCQISVCFCNDPKKD